MNNQLKKYTIYLPEKLHAHVKVYAAMKGTSVSSLIANHLAEITGTEKLYKYKRSEMPRCYKSCLLITLKANEIKDSKKRSVNNYLSRESLEKLLE